MKMNQTKAWGTKRLGTASPTNRGRDGGLPTACSGASLVELLVVFLIVVVLAVGLSAAIAAALSIEQQYREESDIRTAMALQMDYAERYFSLARSITDQTADFRPETGGISLETGHWIRVTGVTLSKTNDVLNFRIVSGDDRRDTTADRAFNSDALLRASLAQPNAARVTAARLEGNGRVRRLVLVTEFSEKMRTNTVVRTITATRPVRMWNVSN